MPFSKLIFRVHAVQRMFERGVTDADVRQVLTAGERIEDYPDDKPYPSYLMLGYSVGRPLHVVAADNSAAGETIVVTVYEPDPRKWDVSLKKRANP